MTGLDTHSTATGIYLVTLGLCLRALLLRRGQLVLKAVRDINWNMLCVAVLMGIFATLDGGMPLSYRFRESHDASGSGFRAAS